MEGLEVVIYIEKKHSQCKQAVLFNVSTGMYKTSCSNT